MCTFNRAGNQLREIRDIQRKSKEIGGRLYSATIHVQRVLQGLKSIEGYADRQHELQNRDIGLTTE